MNLPRRYLISGDAGTEEKWWRKFERLLDVSDSFVQLRYPPDSADNLRRRAVRARKICDQISRKMLLNGPVSMVQSLELDGVHLNARTLMKCQYRPLPATQWVGASCHSLGELLHAEKIGVDFACLSPLFPTSSHPGASGLGLGAFRDLVSECKIPVFALGGVSEDDLSRVNAAGGYGIAGISAWW